MNKIMTASKNEGFKTIGQAPMTAIILAGGKSTRMKVDKALLPVSGTPLIELVAQNMSQYFDEVIISTQSSGLYDFLPYPVVVDTQPGQGPMMGILCGLEASSNAKNFIIACDIPEVNQEFLARMTTYADDFEIVVPITEDGRYEPLFAFYNKSLIPHIKGLLEKNIRQVFQFYPLATMKTLSIKDSSWLYNLNTTEDYQRYIEGRGQNKGNEKWPAPKKADHIKNF